jgi:hypothetical protein
VHAGLQLLIDGEAKLHMTEHKYGRKVHRSHIVFLLTLLDERALA